MSSPFAINYPKSKYWLAKLFRWLTFASKRGIPSSFSGFHGSVKYWIEAEIEKPMFSFNHKTRTEFEVEAPLICDNLMVGNWMTCSLNLCIATHDQIMIYTKASSHFAAFIRAKTWILIFAAFLVWFVYNPWSIKWLTNLPYYHCSQWTLVDDDVSCSFFVPTGVRQLLVDI